LKAAKQKVIALRGVFAALCACPVYARNEGQFGYEKPPVGKAWLEFYPALWILLANRLIFP